MSLLCGHPEALGLAGSGSLFVLGLAGSLHCLGMCGPLSLLVSGQAPGRGLRLGLYHSGRLLAYAGLGWGFWTLGQPLRGQLQWPLLAVLVSLPLILFAVLPSWPRVGFLGSLHALGYGAIRRVPLSLRSLGLGLLTPLLPCGLLYAAAASSLAAPSAAMAALWLLAFASGTLPLLALGQAGAARLSQRSPGTAQSLQRFSAGLAAASILFFALIN